MTNPSWAEVALAALNVVQVIALAWLARGQHIVRQELNGKVDKP